MKSITQGHSSPNVVKTSAVGFVKKNLSVSGCFFNTMKIIWQPFSKSFCLFVCGLNLGNVFLMAKLLNPDVQKVDSAIHRINHYPVDNS